MNEHFIAEKMRSIAAFRIAMDGTDWSVGPALVAGPMIYEELVRRRAATLHQRPQLAWEPWCMVLASADM
jgi:hypothetical protein